MALAKPHAEALDVELVFVSPLTRAIQTAIGLFKYHPRQPQIIVIPSLREMYHTGCDTPSPLSVYEGFKAEYENLDTSLFDAMEDQENWFVDSL